MSTDYLVPRFCSQCGAPVTATERHGERVWPCPQCGHVQTRRPTTGVAVVIVESDELLLVRRAFGEKAGTWCIPCGHVGWQEDIREAAIREVREETGLVVELTGVITALTNLWRPQRCTVGVWFEGRRTGGELRAGDDADDAAFFPLDRLPPLAFPTDEEVASLLRHRR